MIESCFEARISRSAENSSFFEHLRVIITLGFRQTAELQFIAVVSLGCTVKPA